jgi:CheY-like chemotaxis protein
MKRVLIAEDDHMVARTIVRILSPHYDVVSCANGLEAEHELNKSPPYDIVVSDVDMPGLTGLELRDRVKTSNPRLAARFIFYTGTSVPVIEGLTVSKNEPVASLLEVVHAVASAQT